MMPSFANLLARFKILYLDVKSFLIFVFTLFVGMAMYGYLITVIGLSGWLGIIITLLIVSVVLLFFMGLFGLRIQKGKPVI